MLWEVLICDIHVFLFKVIFFKNCIMYYIFYKNMLWKHAEALKLQEGGKS
jgi:hypothetical protein